MEIDLTKEPIKSLIEAKKFLDEFTRICGGPGLYYLHENITKLQNDILMALGSEIDKQMRQK